MVGAAGWRDLVAWAQRAYQLPQRQACRAVGTARASMLYASVRPPQTALCRRLREIAEALLAMSLAPTR